jgi:hypothetical protein
MRHVIETYRGIEIYRSETQFCDPDIAKKIDQPCEAVVEGWRLIGNLQDVKEEIDRKLGSPARQK